MNPTVIKIENFKLSSFRSLIAQSLIVNKQLMLEFGPEFIRSCSYSATNSCLKLWTTETSNLISVPQNDDDSLEPQQITADTSHIPVFDLFILGGDMFAKFLSVYTSDVVDLEFTTQPSKSGKLIASRLKITGLNSTHNTLVTEYQMTTEEMMTNKIDDYKTIIEHCTPSSSMVSIVLSDEQIQETKRLIKKLHKSSAENTAYLTFTVKKDTIQINDAVFNVTFDIPEELRFAQLDEFSFNILKSDFIISGNQTFTIYADETDRRVLFGGKHASAIIWCMFTKVTTDDTDPFTASVADSTLESLDLDDLMEGL